MLVIPPLEMHEFLDFSAMLNKIIHKIKRIYEEIVMYISFGTCSEKSIVNMNYSWN